MHIKVPTREMQFWAESSREPKPLCTGSCREIGSGSGSLTLRGTNSSALNPKFSCAAEQHI